MKPPVVPLNASVHPTARIDPEAVLEGGVTVGPYAVVGPRVHVGAVAEIGPRAVLAGCTRLGQRVRVAAGAQLGVGSPGVPLPYLVVGEGTTIREYATIAGGPPERPTRIGSQAFLMSFVRVGAGTTIGAHVILTHGSQVGEGVVLEDRVVVGGLARVADGVTIGQMAMVAGYSVVRESVPPYLLVFGNPAAVYGINVVGLRRGGLPPATRRKVKQAFRLLYREGLSLEEGLERLAREAGGEPELEYFARFLQDNRPNLITQAGDGPLP